MPDVPYNPVSREIPAAAFNGWPMLFFNILLIPIGIALFGYGAAHHSPIPAFLGIATVIIGVFCFFGYFTLQPNEARVQILFGNYKGTVRAGGFHWANPLYSRSRSTGSQKPSGQVMRALAKTDLKAAMTGANSSALSTKLSLRAHNFK